MAWYWWHHVRKADISQKFRDELERFGEDIITGALVLTFATPEEEEGDHITLEPRFSIFGRSSAALNRFVTQNRTETIEWLTEKRDIAERKADRQECVEIGILVFVVLSVVLDAALLWHALHYQ